MSVSFGPRFAAKRDAGTSTALYAKALITCASALLVCCSRGDGGDSIAPASSLPTAIAIPEQAGQALAAVSRQSEAGSRAGCRTQSDCGPSSYCAAPGAPEPCASCPTSPPCASDVDCQKASPSSICERACNGMCPQRQCMPGCGDGNSCPEGKTCASNHRCEPSVCSTGVQCPAQHSCSNGRCTRRLCSGDVDCAGGYCVSGACYSTSGVCRRRKA